jgi:hypothetical protein
MEVEVYTTLEVIVEDRDGEHVAVDSCDCGQESLTVTLVEALPTQNELEMLDLLEDKGIQTHVSLRKLMDAESLNQESVLKFVLDQSTEFKFDLVKKLLAKD